MGTKRSNMAKENQMLLEAFVEALGQEIKEAYELGLSSEEIVASLLCYSCTITQTDIGLEPTEFLEFVASSWNDRAEKTGGPLIQIHDDVEELLEYIEEDKEKDSN